MAKLIVHGRDRADAIRRLRAALADAPLLGVVNNGRFLHDLLGHAAFAHAMLHTTLIDDWAAQAEPLLQRPQPDDAAWLIAAAACALRDVEAGASALPLRPASVAAWQLTLCCQGQTRTFTVLPQGELVQVAMAMAGAKPHPHPQAHTLRRLQHDGRHLRIALDGVQRRVLCHHDGAQLHLARQAAAFVFTEPSPYPAQDAAADARRVLVPVADTVAQVAVQPGDHVAEGQPLDCVEAMKMEMWQHAGAAGTVAAVHVATRSTVAAGTLLVELTLDPIAES